MCTENRVVFFEENWNLKIKAVPVNAKTIDNLSGSDDGGEAEKTPPRVLGNPTKGQGLGPPVVLEIYKICMNRVTIVS